VVLLLPYDGAQQPHRIGSTPAAGAVLLTRLEFPPQAPTRLTGGGFAADDDADQAQLQQQSQQQLQQAQEQTDAAEQQFNQDMQQQQTYENQFNNP
jgi:hypothetical protein